MPQLIAMIIIVVGAMIYMFQTFGGTGDKIEGIAQKTSIITEINNIKNGLKLAARAGDISTTSIEIDNPDANVGGKIKVPSDLKALGQAAYFAEQINVQLKENNVSNRNKYFAISFGGDKDKNGGMVVSLVSNTEKAIPGIYVDLSEGSLSSNAGFLESQIATDLAAVATIDRKATAATAGALATGGTKTDIELRTPVTAGSGGDQDGKLIIYFKDFGSNEVVVK